MKKYTMNKRNRPNQKIKVAVSKRKNNKQKNGVKQCKTKASPLIQNIPNENTNIVFPRDL